MPNSFNAPGVTQRSHAFREFRQCGNIEIRLRSNHPLCGVVMNKHELSKTEFELIEKGLNALLNSGPDPALAEKIKDLRGMFMDAYTGWLEIEDEAA